MKQMEFIEVHQPAQIAKVAQIADETWHEHYEDILAPNQIDYMVEKFQSTKAIIGQMINEKYQYFLLFINGEAVGYAAIHEDLKTNKLFLSKLYILEKYREHGYGSQAFKFFEDVCREKGYGAIWLTVNRFNQDSISVYEKKGFVIVRTQVSDIGEGYVMDDYIMEKSVEQKEFCTI